jgi:PAS domain S-box-containing protein
LLKITIADRPYFYLCYLEHEKDILALHRTFQKLVEGVESLSLTLLDEHGTILTWNRGVQAIKGYTAEEIIGQHISMFYLPVDRQAGLPERLLQQARNFGNARHVGRRIRKNGTTFWGSIEITSIKDDHGRVIGFTNLARELNNENEIGQFWFDSLGILHTKASKVSHTPEKIREFRNLFASATNGVKLCVVADVTDANVTEAQANFGASSVLERYKAVAFISSAEIDLNTKTIVGLLPKNLPFAIFTTREEAVEWITPYL